MDRGQVIERLEAIRGQNELAELAFCAYRDLKRTVPATVPQGSLERCPVCVAATSG